jgi:folylpolyglutamate synthase/dihydropteroate synthase
VDLDVGADGSRDFSSILERLSPLRLRLISLGDLEPALTSLQPQSSILVCGSFYLTGEVFKILKRSQVAV